MSDIQDEEQRLAAEADENMAAWEAGVARIKADLQARMPEFFDEAGELRSEEVMKVILQRTGGRRSLTGAEFLDLMRNRSAHTVDAP